MMVCSQVVAIAKTNYASAADEAFGGDEISVMDRSNDDPVIWHERILQVCVAPTAPPTYLLSAGDLVSDVLS